MQSFILPKASEQVVGIRVVPIAMIADEQKTRRIQYQGKGEGKVDLVRELAYG